jgi:dTDP-4-dehydrorhamnose reductase
MGGRRVRIAVTGAGGGLGRAFLSRGAGGQDVIPFTHRDLAVEDAQATRAALLGARPEVVVHLAAMTSVDGCERDPEGARLVNVEGTANVARAAREAGASLVALSTDYVFDGQKEDPYDERDEPNPLSVYGRTKLEAERAVSEAGGRWLVVRTSWVFGAEGEFVRRAVARLARGDEVGGIVDQTGTPTFVGHLAERLVPLIQSECSGIVHLAGSEPATWYDVLMQAKALGDLPGEVVEQKADELDRPAPRPRNSALASVVLPTTGVPPMPPLDEGIAEVVARGR